MIRAPLGFTRRLVWRLGKRRPSLVALVSLHQGPYRLQETRDGRVPLATKNSPLEPITLAPLDVEIQGVLIGQMRAYR
jgi:hypothetical protein